MVLPFDQLTHPLVIAHRGSMVLGPENTIYSFDLALSAGADVLEMDVHPSVDGEIMVIHDPTVDRTSNGSGEVAAIERGELQQLDFAWNFSLEEGTYPLRGQGIRIPTLGEVFDRFPDRHYSIDIKRDDLKFAASVVELIMKRGMRDQIVLGSFHSSVAELLRRALPPLHVAADRPQGKRLLAASLLHLPLGTHLPSAYMLPDRLGVLNVASRTLIRRIHRAGRRGYFWTVDSERTMRRLLLAGADGIVTNRPDLLYSLRNEQMKTAEAVD